MPELVRRRDATQATEDRFRWKVADWKTQTTCLHMAHFHLKAMGVKVPRVPPVRGPIAARKLLDRHGWADMAAVIDAQGLERIAPAMMLVGDLAYRASADGLGSVMICCGPHKLLGWFENDPRMVIMDMSFDQIETGWRTWLPR